MSTGQIRRFAYSDADYAAKASLLKALDPTSAVTVEKLKFWDRWWDPKYRRETFLVEIDEQPVAMGGYGEWLWWYEPGRYLVELDVHPAFSQQGLDAMLYDHLMSRMAAQEPKGTIFMYKCREDQPERIRFITQQGFQQTGRELWSALDVAAFDLARFAPVDERMRQQGITILTYPELAAADPLCQRKCYALRCESIQDMPGASGIRTHQSFEQYIQQVFERVEFIPEAFFVALDQGHYVGVSYLINEHEDREHLVTAYTGVIPSYRRRGIATALNLCCIQYAKAHQARTITTDTDEANPIYQLNAGLGFKPRPSELHFEFNLKSAVDGAGVPPLGALETPPMMPASQGAEAYRQAAQAVSARNTQGTGMPPKPELPDALQTNRLHLRGPVPDDTAEFYRAMLESQSALRPWFAWAEFTPTPASSAAFVAESYRGFQARRQLDWFVFLKGTQTLIGIITLHSRQMGTVDWSQSTQLLLYWLRTGYTGQGYMTEAVTAVRDLFLALPGITQLEIRCDVANARGAALAKRVGFHYQATVPDYATFEDIYVKER